MHRALLLPELVALILEAGKSYEGLLYSAVCVNRLFFKETSRLLWYRCGQDWKSAKLTTIEKPPKDEPEDMDFFEENPQKAMEEDHQGVIEYVKLNASWTQKAFEAIAKYQHLELLMIPFTKDAWVSALAHTSPFHN